MADQAVLDKIKKLREGGERGRAIDLAIEHKVRPVDVPFIEDYQFALDTKGLNFEPVEAENIQPPKGKK